MTRGKPLTEVEKNIIIKDIAKGDDWSALFGKSCTKENRQMCFEDGDG